MLKDFVLLDNIRSEIISHLDSIQVVNLLKEQYDLASDNQVEYHKKEIRELEQEREVLENGK